MRIETFLQQDAAWDGPFALTDAQLVFYFAAPAVLREQDVHAALKKSYPQAHIVGGSTGGEILGEDVYDNSVVGAALQLEKGTVRVVSVPVAESSADIGQALAAALTADGADLKAVFVLSDGLHVNGTELVEQLVQHLPEEVQVTGGLAGDGADFTETYVGADAAPQSKQAVAVGFYGEAIVASSGCMGGWAPFGPVRRITKSDGPVLYELDGKPALALYKEYLGEEAEHLPSSGLLYPLELTPGGEDGDPANRIVRTVLSVDEKTQSMTFAGDIPQDFNAQFMSAQFAQLVDGAAQSAHQAAAAGVEGDSLAILVSCIGRKLLMGQRISDETDAVAEGLPVQTHMIGFYSYGEIAPNGFTGECQLHNQTMTITLLGEAA